MWKFWIDTGGTFTDCLAETPEGDELRLKTLSNSAIRGRLKEQLSPRELRIDLPVGAGDHFFDGYRVDFHDETTEPILIKSWRGRDSLAILFDDAPELPDKVLCSLQSPEEAPLLAIRLLTKRRLNEALPPLEMRLATTRGTNALLEEKGAKIAFFVTKGFKDLLRIGDQRRPDLFELGIRKRQPLHESVFEVEERLNAEGEVLAELNEAALFEEASSCVEEGITTGAIGFLHSYRNPDHERRAAEILREAGFERVSISSELAPKIKLLPRAETAVVDAYLAPIMEAYLDAVESAVGRSGLSVMTSSGGLVSRARYRPKDSLLSGPAGGVVGASRVGSVAGAHRVIAFDMGGTSTDVSRYDGRFDYQFQQIIGNARVFAPSLRIETVAAGGGSICWYDGSALRVGPESAGASPGPACYGAGGPLTLTDVNLLLGRLDPSKFSIPVFPEASSDRLSEIMAKVNRQSGEQLAEEAVLKGFLEIADERMADAIRSISLRDGYSPTEYALVAFGGAGGLHACAIADILGMDTILLPSDAGLLSALGLKFSRMEEFAERQILKPLTIFVNSIPKGIQELESDAKSSLISQGIAPSDLVRETARVELRFAGQEAALLVDWDSSRSLENAFQNDFRKQYGFLPEQPIEVVSLKVSVATRKPVEPRELFPEYLGSQLTSQGFAPRASLDGSWAIGPLSVQDEYSTIYVGEGWKAVLGGRETVKLIKGKEEAKTKSVDIEAAQLELFTNRYLSLVEEMGSLLERSAFSTNVKERMDFSCALLDREGFLIANAPHIPVHLGALGVCVRSVRETIDLGPGDIVVTNHPRFGGSHLPDITLIASAFSEDGQRIGYIANRAHHAELGGIAPGSMPPRARSLVEEGVVIEPMYLAREGSVDWEPVRSALIRAPFPTRNLQENLSDLAAQLASVRFGVSELEKLVSSEGFDRSVGYMRGMRERARLAIADVFDQIPNTERKVVEQLDDGAIISVSIRKSGKSRIIDFSGSAERQSSNYNATSAIVTSAVVYVLRLLAGDTIPLNEGLLEDLDLRIPEGMLNPRFPSDLAKCPPVVAGNVEVSQRIVDALLKAFEVAACSQGTMNNLIFGNDNASYYETIAGGEGATRDRDGASGVHTHMTNTSITDPEILEWRYPARVELFSLRDGSGGKGVHNGGDGVSRRIRFTEAVEVSLLTQHREQAPFGIEGGEDGGVGKQWKVSSDGKRRPLSGNETQKFDAGDAIEIHTPGGGGFGRREI